jgi:hypothetical protein
MVGLGTMKRETRAAKEKKRRLLLQPVARTKPLEWKDVSASLDRRSEDIRILPVVIAELELGNIQRHIFAAHFVECSDNTALEDRPESFDGLSVDCANNILASRMVIQSRGGNPCRAGYSLDIDRYKAS